MISMSLSSNGDFPDRAQKCLVVGIGADRDPHKGRHAPELPGPNVDLPLVQASHFLEELLIVHNLDLRGARDFERADFDYEFDFREVHRAMKDSNAREESID